MNNNKISDEYQKIIAYTWKTGNSLVITIPWRLAKYMGLEEGQVVKAMLKKEVNINGKED